MRERKTSTPKTSHRPLVSIIIPTLNGKYYLKNCLESLEKQSYSNAEIIIVDNGSNDGSVEFVKSTYPWVNILENGKNLGFAQGNNIGADRARGDFIVFLNNDAEVEKRWLERLVETALDSSVGICGCKVIDYDKRDVALFVGGLLDEFGFPFGIPQSRWPQPDPNQIDVQVVSGTGFLIRTDVWKKLNGFDSAYFAYMEEIDLCWRARLLGYRVVVDPLALLYHRRFGQTTRKVSYPEKKYWSERNTLRMLIKNYSTGTFVRLLPKYLALASAESFFLVATRKMWVSLAYFRAFLWNLKNFRDTWSRHEEIQQARVFPEHSIREKMYPNVAKLLLFHSRRIQHTTG